MVESMEASGRHGGMSRKLGAHILNYILEAQSELKMTRVFKLLKPSSNEASPNKAETCPNLLNHSTQCHKLGPNVQTHKPMWSILT